MIATEAGLGVRPANEVRFLVIASPAGAYFPEGLKPVSIWLSEQYTAPRPVAPAQRRPPATTQRA